LSIFSKYGHKQNKVVIKVVPGADAVTLSLWLIHNAMHVLRVELEAQGYFILAGSEDKGNLQLKKEINTLYSSALPARME
jgi:hypothetical protein